MNGNSNHLSFGYHGIQVNMAVESGGRGKTKSPSMDVKKKRKFISSIITSTMMVDAAEVWEVDSNVNCSSRCDVKYVFGCGSVPKSLWT